MRKVYDIRNVRNGNKFMVRPAGGGPPQIVHNCSQHISGAVFNDMHLRIDARAKDEADGIFAGSVHDELLYSTPEQHGQRMLAIMSQEMCKPPVWWPELPVTSEGDYGYGIIEYQP